MLTVRLPRFDLLAVDPATDPDFWRLTGTMSSSFLDCNRDSVFPFHLRQSPIRGRIVRLSGVLDDLVGRHDYPEPVNDVVAEAVVLTALIGQLVNFGWKFSLQFRSDGPLRLVAADYSAPGQAGQPARVRAHASYRPAAAEPAGGSLVSAGRKGYLAVMIDRGDGREPFKGMTPVAGDSLAACAEEYFRRSEQIPTRLTVAATRSADNGRRHRQAGGIMIQRIPESSPAGEDRPPGPEQGRADDGEDWIRACAALATVSAPELSGPQPTSAELVWQLFHEDRPLAGECQPVRFGCACSVERVRRSLSIYSARDIASMTTEKNVVTADCQFCGAHYELDPAELGIGAAE